MPTAISAAPSSLSSSKCSTSGRRQAVAAPRAPCRRHAGRGAHRLAATYRVDLDINGTLHVLDVDENDTILQTAMDAGLEVPHDCRMGVCEWHDLGAAAAAASAAYRLGAPGASLRPLNDAFSSCNGLPTLMILQPPVETPHFFPPTPRTGLRCASRITEGDVDQSGGMISDEAADKGYALLCVSYPQSAASVKIIPEV